MYTITLMMNHRIIESTQQSHEMLDQDSFPTTSDFEDFS